MKKQGSTSHLLKTLAGGCLLLLLSIAPAEAQLLDNALSGLEQRATTVVNNAGEQGRGVAMEAGQSALNAISAFRAAYAESLDRTLDGLGGAERRTYEDLTALIVTAETSSRAVTSDLTEITERLNSLAGSLPLGSRIPALLRVAPQYFVPKENAPVQIRMRGLNLAFGSPVLEIAGKRLQPSRELDNELVFDLPGNLLERLPLVKVLSGKLLVYESQRSYLIFSRLVEHSYRVALYRLPPTVGTYQLSAKREVMTEEKAAQKTGEFRCDSPRGGGTHHRSVGVTAREGWRIDPATIKYHPTYSNHGGHSYGSQGSSGFTARQRCEGWGKVVVGGVTFDKGSIGVEKGYYTYTESRDRKDQVVEPVKSGSLRWEETVLFPQLPPNTKTVTVQFQPFIGAPTAAQGVDEGNRFFTLDYNAAAQTARLTARGLEEVMNR